MIEPALECRGKTEERYSPYQIINQDQVNKTWTDIILDCAGGQLNIDRVLKTLGLSGDAIRYRHFFLDPDKKDLIGKDKIYFILAEEVCYSVRGSDSSYLCEDKFSKLRGIEDTSTAVECLCMITSALDESRAPLFRKIKRLVENLKDKRENGPLSKSDAVTLRFISQGLDYLERKLEHHRTDLVWLSEQRGFVADCQKDRKAFSESLRKHSISAEAVKTLIAGVREIYSINQREDQDASRRLTDTYRKYGLMFAPLTTVSLLASATSHLSGSIEAFRWIYEKLLVLSATWIPVYGGILLRGQIKAIISDIKQKK